MQLESVLPYRTIDMDNHFVEPDDAFTLFIEPQFVSHTLRVQRDAHGAGTCYIGDRLFEYIPHSALGPTGTPPAPATKRGMQTGKLDPAYENSEATQREAQRVYGELHGTRVPGVDRDVHLASLDARGTQAALLFPTHGLAVEYQLRSQFPAPVVYGVLRAYNRWIDDAWGFEFQHRIFAAPVISLLDPPLALAELQRVVAAGARAIQVTAGCRPDGSSPAIPALDPFWHTIQDAGILVCFHAGDTGEQNRFQFDPAATRSRVFEFDAMQCYARLGQSISDTLAMLILHNLFGRFPRVKVASIENGSNWVPLLLQRIDIAASIARHRKWPCGRLDDRPSAIFRRHVLVNPFCEEELPPLVELIGEESVIYGSDFPHPEGSATPNEYVSALTGVPDTQVRAIMRDNGAALIGVGA
jgi:predicted TIM-barrel fold metal-dependent hydrolase